jgi:hypothetical protein
MKPEALERIEQSLSENNKLLVAILSKLESMTELNTKLGEHINFVEKVYEVARTPLDFVRSSVLAMTGESEHQPFPLLH